ncbi:uncharacterized protein BX664DRAFT_367584 [Halteromyces radiatus]|uniref:uncharacterized protein n=1 Tax=Halteromyces radiatus TaxID=101107 RepID=UPI00221FE991|nr:uncharacterized protein BX664DRAFT_367584 [Halteromyces radiatus]KAI8098682.1 hypothetical protein BX664DRAFT_367584 [Halteromyces radiatus]
MPVAINSQYHQVYDFKHSIVKEILSASNYYDVLNVDRTATTDEIRKAYIQKSRACHPDKIPNDPRATECFQRLVLAHETLINPTARLKYDITEDNDNYDISTHVEDEESTQEVFERVVHQLYSEMIDGEFQTMRVILSAINEIHPYLNLSNEIINHTEDAFKMIRGLLFSTQKYYKVVQFELIRLYDLQQEMRLLGLFDIKKRIQLSISMGVLLLEIPIIINNSSKENHHSGVLGTMMESALGSMIYVLQCIA